MTRPATLGIAAVVLLSAFSAVPADDQGPSASEGGEDRAGWDRFSVLIERNIFLRDRREARPRSGEQREPVVVPRDPNADLVLVGTVVGADLSAVAFLENTRTGEVQRLAVNDAAGTGRISDITLEGIAWAREEATTQIEIGHSLGGGPARPSAAPAGAGTGASGTPSEDDTASILERMRRQREQELSQ